ncbi:MAG: barstar family protein [Ancrocorticia sp.]
MTNFDVLLTVESELRPLVFEGDDDVLYSAMFQWRKQELTVRVVRGRKMRTKQSLFDEFAASLQFPLYFGENWDAFDECVRDLEDLPAGKGYVVVITEPDDVLLGEDERGLRLLVNSLTDAAGEWGKPIERGEWWDRSSVPFHVVLVGQCEVLERASRRWTAAGAELQTLE